MNQLELKSLKNQTVIISGASQGIGAAVAKALAAEGMNLVLCARNVEKMNALAAELRAIQAQAQAVGSEAELKTLVLPCDVTDATQVQQVVDETLKAFGRIDVLFNNAGVAPRAGLMQELSVADIDRTIDTNLKGALYFMRAVLPPMVEKQTGTIINVNSIAGKTAYPYWSVYDASKFGLYAATEAVAEEQRTNGIKVVGIYPGAVDTPIWQGIELPEEPDRAGMLDAGDIAEAVLYILRQPRKVFVKDVTLTPLMPVV